MCALRFIDGFDHYVTADLTEKWTALVPSVSISAGTGRRGTASLRNSNDDGAYITLSLDNQATWILGFAFCYTVLPGAGSVGIANWYDATTLQTELRVEVTGKLGVYRGTAKLGETTAILATNTFYYVEWYVKHDQTAGEMRVAVNGVPDLALTALDTTMSANAYASLLRLGNHGTNSGFRLGNQDFDDLYLCDGVGAAPYTTFLGDCRVDLLLPTGDGANSAWTPSTGTTHSTLVDETAPNDDTDYLSTLTVGARETHNFPNLPAMTNPAILAVQHCISARKDDAGTRQLKSVVKSGATTQVGATTLTIASTYAYYRELWLTDPATGVAWTTAGVNAMEAGFDNLV